MDPNDFRNGLLIRCDRDLAKQLFSARDPDRLRSILGEQVTAVTADGVPIWVSCGGLGNQLQAALVRAAGDDERRVAALSMALTGGRPLSTDPAFTVSVVRPDMVPHVDEALTTLGDTPLADLTTDAQGVDVGAVATLLHAVRRLYHDAAREGHAVIFAAQA